MKNIVFCLVICMLAACSTNKVTKISVKNRNSFPISVTVKALNSAQSIEHIAGKSTGEGVLDWTTIRKEEGEYVILVKNDQTQGVDSFSHGYYQQGDLCGYIDLIAEGSQLKIQLSE